MLEKVDFPKNTELQIIEKAAFAHTKIKSIAIPSTVTQLGNAAFSSKVLSIIDIPDNSQLQKIGGSSFATLITTLNLPSDVELEDGFCGSTPNLININIIQKKEKKIIYYENKLILSKSSPEIDDYDVLLFANRNLTSVTIPPFIKKIGIGSFMDSLIEKIEIPPHVNQIGDHAFSYCTKLKSFDVYKNTELESLSNEMFYASNFYNKPTTKDVIINAPKKLKFDDDFKFNISFYKN